MSKTFILKRNTSNEERPTLPSVESRSRSLSRNGFYYPYVKSEFGFDGSPLRCQPHDSPRNNFYYPATQENRSNEYSDRKPQKRSSSQRFSSPDNFTVKRKRKTSPSPATNKGDFRRKMVFVLHEEVKKSPCTTALEEISDVDRITEMCMSTLRSMMENKKYRKFLHHMNNNNSLPWYNYILCIGSVGSFDSIIE